MPGITAATRDGLKMVLVARTAMTVEGVVAIVVGATEVR